MSNEEDLKAAKNGNEEIAQGMINGIIKFTGM